MSFYSSLKCRTVLLVLLPVVSALAGCDLAPERHALAILRVHRRTESAADYLIYRDTQGSLLKSQFVIENVLRKPSEKYDSKALSVEQLGQEMDVQMPENSELINVRLPLRGRDRDETEAILNAVIDGYLSEIVNKERLEKVETLSKLRARYRVLFDEVKKKTDEVNHLARELGTDQQEHHTGRLAAQHLDRLLASQLKLELLRIEANQLNQTDQQAVLRQQLDYVAAQIEVARSGLQILGSDSGEVEARRNDLTTMNRDMQAVGASIQELELELDGPRRVTVIQRAHVRHGQ